MSFAKDTIEFTDADFAAWNEQAEEAAIEALKKNTEIRYIISEGRFFVAQFPDGHIIKAPIQIDMGVIEAVSDDLGPAEQMKMLLQLLGQDEDVTYLQNTNLLSVMDMAAKFFRIFERLTQASMGEYLR